jgi:F0F1-type ATP synthase assembly protein I
VGWFVALSLIIPVGIGYWLDSPKMFDKRPLFTFIGLGIGTVIAFFGLFRMLIRYQAEQEKIKKDQK